MLLRCRFGETPVDKEETLTRELFTKLCLKLQEKTGVHRGKKMNDRLKYSLPRISGASKLTEMNC